MGYTAGLAASLLLFQSLPPGTAPLLQWLSVAAIGFCIYGPQMLVGLCGAELVHPGSVGASQGVLGWIAYLGAANAGACELRARDVEGTARGAQGHGGTGWWWARPNWEAAAGHSGQCSAPRSAASR